MKHRQSEKTATERRLRGAAPPNDASACCRGLRIDSAAALACFAAACSAAAVQGKGDVSVAVEAEDVIIDGLSAGDGPADVRDGWQVRFDAYTVAIGHIDLRYSADEEVGVEADEVYAIDLTAIPAAGEVLWTFSDIRAGRWEFNYSTVGAADGVERHASVSADDFAEMQAGDWTYLITGAIEQTGGRSCPPASLANVPAGAEPDGSNDRSDPCYPNPEVTFRWGANAETTYGPCEVDGVPGFNVAAGGSQTVGATLHGDHLFFNGFPEGSEGGVMRLAQWLADCDLDLDGAVTRGELEALSPSDLAELDDRFQLGGSPITPLVTMWDYVVAQLKTQGHFRGEGQCPIDGQGHEH